MSKLPIDTNIIAGVTKSLDQTLKGLEQDIKSNQLMVKGVEKDLEKLIPKGEKKKAQMSPITQDRMKYIAELKRKENELKSGLVKIVANKEILKEKDDFNKKNKNTNVIEKNIIKSQLRNVMNKEEIVSQRIETINDQINRIVFEEKSKDFEQRKEVIKNFVANLEKDKETTNIKAKEYEEYYKRLQEKMKNDIKEKALKLKKEIEDKKEEEKKREKEKVQNFIKMQRGIEKKRSDDINKKISNIKNFTDEMPRTYLHMNKKEKFLTEQEKLLKKEKAKRKQYFRHITQEEIDEMVAKHDEVKQKSKEKIEENWKKKFEEWKKNKEALPKYESPFLETAEKEAHKIEIDEEDKLKQIEKNLKAKKEFSENLVEPRPNEKLKKEREQRDIPPPKKKDTIYDHKKARIILRKRNPEEKSKRITWELKLNANEQAEQEKKRNAIKKPKQINLSALSTSVERTKRVVPEKKIDYLSTMIKEREKEKVAEMKRSLDSSNYLDNKWNKMLKKNNSSGVEGVQKVKSKIDRIDEEIKKKELLLKYAGGNEQKAEMRDQISSMLIDSIKGKLSILNNFSTGN